jgi:SAM-dependent methyltransferase
MKKISWHKIFNNSKFSYIFKSKLIKNNKKFISTSYLLCKIIYPNLNKKKFFKILSFISSTLRIKKNDSLLDFGSGNGSFLYFFINKYNLKKNYSFEISSPLIKIQKKFIKEAEFFKTHHIKTTIFKKFNSNLVDYSMSNSVFQYFYNDKYSYKVLEFLLKVTRKKILIYDIKNSETKNIYRETVRKRQNLSKLKFKEKYKKSPIRFYSKNTFKKYLTKLQKKYDFNFKFKNLPSTTTDYKYGYCLLIEKRF